MDQTDSMSFRQGFRRLTKQIRRSMDRERTRVRNRILEVGTRNKIHDKVFSGRAAISPTFLPRIQTGNNVGML